MRTSAQIRRASVALLCVCALMACGVGGLGGNLGALPTPDPFPTFAPFPTFTPFPTQPPGPDLQHFCPQPGQLQGIVGAALEFSPGFGNVTSVSATCAYRPAGGAAHGPLGILVIQVFPSTQQALSYYQTFKNADANYHHLQNISGLGDAAFFDGESLFMVKGVSYVQVKWLWQPPVSESTEQRVDVGVARLLLGRI